MSDFSIDINLNTNKLEQILDSNVEEQELTSESSRPKKKIKRTELEALAEINALIDGLEETEKKAKKPRKKKLQEAKEIVEAVDDISETVDKPTRPLNKNKVKDLVDTVQAVDGLSKVVGNTTSKKKKVSNIDPSIVEREKGVKESANKEIVPVKKTETKVSQNDQESTSSSKYPAFMPRKGTDVNSLDYELQAVTYSRNKQQYFLKQNLKALSQATDSEEAEEIRSNIKAIKSSLLKIIQEYKEVVAEMVGSVSSSLKESAAQNLKTNELSSLSEEFKESSVDKLRSRIAQLSEQYKESPADKLRTRITQLTEKYKESPADKLRSRIAQLTEQYKENSVQKLLQAGVGEALPTSLRPEVILKPYQRMLPAGKTEEVNLDGLDFSGMKRKSLKRLMPSAKSPLDPDFDNTPGKLARIYGPSPQYDFDVTPITDPILGGAGPNQKRLNPAPPRMLMPADYSFVSNERPITNIATAIANLKEAESAYRLELKRSLNQDTESVKEARSRLNSAIADLRVSANFESKKDFSKYDENALAGVRAIANTAEKNSIFNGKQQSKKQESKTELEANKEFNDKQKLERSFYQVVSTRTSKLVSDLRLQETLRQAGLPNNTEGSRERLANQVLKIRSELSPNNTTLFNDRLSNLANRTEKTLQQFDYRSQVAGTRIGNLARDFFYLSSAARGAIEGLQNLASFASSRELSVSRLNIANKLDLSQTGRDVEFLKKTTRELGLSLSDSLQDLGRFKLSTPLAELDRLGNTQQPKLSSEQLNTIFKGISDVSVANQLDQGQRAGINNVITQILSKGEVSGQEIRLQLPNFLPGAISLFAKSQGVDGSEFNKRLERREVGISSLVDFSRLLSREFGDLAKIDTPAKALAKFSSELENIGVKAAQVPAGLGLAASGVVNPALRGVQENTSTFAPIFGLAGVAASSVFVPAFVAGVGSKLRSDAGRAILSSLISGLNFEGSLKDQIGGVLFGSSSFGSKAQPQATALGKSLGLLLGAGILSSVTVALTGGEGLDDYFSKLSSNVGKGVDSLRRKVFGDDKQNTANGTNRTLEDIGGGVRDTFAQILPAALGVSSLGGLAKAGIDKGLETGFLKDNKLTSAAGSIAGSLASLPVALGVALTGYIVANSQFVTAFKDTSDKTVKELQTVANLLNKDAAQNAANSKDEVISKRESFLSTARKAPNTGIAVVGDLLDNISDSLNTDIKSVGDRRLAQLIDIEKKRIANSSAGDLFEGDSKKRLAELEKEADRRAKGGSIAPGFRLEGLVGLSGSVEARAKERQEGVNDIVREADSLINKYRTQKVAVKEDPQLEAQLAADRKRRAELLSTPFKDLQTERNNNDELTTLNTRINKGNFAINEGKLIPLKDRVASVTGNIQSVENAISKLTADTLKEGGVGAINGEAFKKQVEELQKRKREFQLELIAAQDALNAQDPAFRIAQESIKAAGLERVRSRQSDQNSLDSSVSLQEDNRRRITEGNDRASGIRQSFQSLTDAKRAEVLQGQRVGDLEGQLKRLELLAPSEEVDKEIRTLSDKILSAKSVLQQAIVSRQKAEIDLQRTKEAADSQEVALRVAKQTRGLERKNLQNQDAVLKVIPNEQNTLANARNNVISASNAERLAAFQVKEQEALVKRTVLNREEAEQKLEDLRTDLLRKGVEKRAAQRAEAEARESRDIELTGRRITGFTQTTDRLSARFSEQRALASKGNEGDELRSTADSLLIAQQQYSDSQRALAEQQALVNRSRFTTETQILRLNELRLNSEQKASEVQNARLAKLRADLDVAFKGIDRILAASKVREEGRNTQFSNDLNNQTALSNLGTSDRFETDLSIRNAVNNLNSQKREAQRQASVGSVEEANAFNASLEPLGIPGKITQEAFNKLGQISLEELTTVGIRLEEARKRFTDNPNAVGGEAVKVDIGGGFNFDFGSSNSTVQALERYQAFNNSLIEQKKKQIELEQGITQAQIALEGAVRDAEKKANLATQGLEDETLNNLKVKRNRDTANTLERQAVTRIFENAGKTSNFVSVGSSIEEKISTLQNNQNNRLASNAALELASKRQIENLNKQKEVNRSSGASPEQIARLNGAIDRQIRAIEANTKSKLDDNDTADFTSISRDIATALSGIANAEDRRVTEETRRFNRGNEAKDLRNSLLIGDETQSQREERSIRTQVQNQRAGLQQEIEALSKDVSLPDLQASLTRLRGLAKNPNDIAYLDNLEQQLSQLEATGRASSETISKTVEALKSFIITDEELNEALRKSARIRELNTNATYLNNLADLDTERTGRLRDGRRSGFISLERGTIVAETNANNLKNRARAELDSIQAERIGAGPLTAEEDLARFGLREQKVVKKLQKDLEELSTPLRVISEDLSEIVANGLNFSQFAKTWSKEGGTFNEAITEMTTALLEGLANYFSNRAQKALQNVFEGLFDSILSVMYGSLERRQGAFTSLGKEFSGFLGGGKENSGGFDLGGLFSGFLGGNEGSSVGISSEVATNWLDFMTGSITDLLPSFANGTLGEVTMGNQYPRTPSLDPREGGRDSRLAVINAQEAVVPAYMAQDFLKYRDYLSGINGGNQTVNNSSYATTTNNYIVNPDTFGRTMGSSVVINDRQQGYRDRYGN